MPEPLLDVRGVDAYYGDFQALFGVSLRVEPGEVVAVIGANGAGKSTLLKTIAGMMAPRRGDIIFDGQPIGGAPAFDVRQARHRAGAGRTAAVSVAHSRGKPLDRRPIAPPRPVDAGARLSAVPGPGRAAAPARARAVRRAAADGGDRPRADVEPAPVAVRRDQPRPRANRGARHLRATAGNRDGRLVADRGRAGHRAGAQSRAPGLLPAGGPDRAAGRGARADARDRSRRRISGCDGDAMAQRHPARRADRRALRHVRRRAVADLRRDAARQHRARRSDRARRLRRAGGDAGARHRPAHLAAAGGADHGASSATRCSAGCSISRSATTCCRRCW